MMKSALDVNSEKHPVHREVVKNTGTMNLAVEVKEDTQTISDLKHIEGVIAFVVFLKIGNELIGVGRSVSVVGKMNKYFEKTILYTKNAAIIDAVVKSVKILDARNLDLPGQLNSGIMLDKEYRVKKVENSDSITEKQKKYLMQLIHQNCTDKKESESLVNQLDDMSSFEASEQIKSFIGA
jgi:hypothetical protein